MSPGSHPPDQRRSRAAMYLDRARDKVPEGVQRRYRQAVVDEFARLYYGDPTETSDRIWQHTSFLGTPIWKNPLDLWIYQEMLHELRPDLIIETGTSYGGSALYLGTLCDVLDRGEVVSIDIARRETPPPPHPRVTYRLGSSIDPEVVSDLAKLAADAETVLIILDSDHHRNHVLAELRAYAPMVTVGSYVVVEDSNINGHPVHFAFGPGPMEAIDAFLAENADFEIDLSREKFLFTFNPRGYLRRMR